MLFEAMVMIILLQALLIAWLLGCAMVLNWGPPRVQSGGIVDSNSAYGPLRNSRGEAVQKARRGADGKLRYSTRSSSSGEVVEDASPVEYPLGSPATPIVAMPASPETPPRANQGKPMMRWCLMKWKRTKKVP